MVVKIIDCASVVVKVLTWALTHWHFWFNLSQTIWFVKWRREAQGRRQIIWSKRFLRDKFYIVFFNIFSFLRDFL